MDEIDRVVKDKGILILSTPNFLSLVHRIKFLLGIRVEYDISDEPEYSGVYGHIREYTVYELTQILKKRGYTIKKIKMVNTSYGNVIIDFFNSIICKVFPFLSNNIIIAAEKIDKKT